MIIIAGYTRTDAEKRDGAVDAFRGMVERARAYDGCLDFSISADAVDPERVNLFECWRDQTTLDAWRKVAKGPRGMKPREAAVSLYRTDKAEKPF
jgi:quinol monooxygenase YgiN